MRKLWFGCNNYWRAIALFLVLSWPAPQAGAGVTAEVSRIIYPANQQDHAVQLYNANAYPVLVQVWVDEGDLNTHPDNTTAPFVALPPLFRLNPQEQTSIRIIYTGKPAKLQQEMLYWFNTYEVPPDRATQQDTAPELAKLRLIMRTQTKLLFRPATLQPLSHAIVKSLQIRQQAGPILELSNPTPYYLSLINLLWQAPGQEAAVLPAQTIPPRGQVQLVLPEQAGSQGQLQFSLINDDGEYWPYQFHLEAGQARLLEKMY